MRSFQGSVKALAGEFRTYEELIITALAARVFDAGDGANNYVLKSRSISQVKAAGAMNVFTNPDADIYVMDCFRKGGIIGGVTQQAAWLAGDFTQSPGGGEKLSQGKLNPDGHWQKLDLGNRIIYAVVDTTIWLDVHLG